MADASSEAFAAIFINSQDGSEFHDVAVSARIVKKMSLHSFYFFASSSGLYFTIKHNGTQIPALNFVSRSMQVDEVVEALQANGFKSLFADNSIPNAPSASDVSNTFHRNFRSLNSQNSGNFSGTSRSQKSNEVAAFCTLNFFSACQFYLYARTMNHISQNNSKYVYADNSTECFSATGHQHNIFICGM
jgi:hypothetical protein